MLNNVFIKFLDQTHAYVLYAFLSFLVTAVLLKIDFKFLPRDQGRIYALNGELSKGKTRGVGLIMMISFVLFSFLFIPFSVEFLLYAAFIIFEMISGYLDDASSSSWSEYKKGLIDLVVSVLISVIFVFNNSTDIYFGKSLISIHPVLYVILATVLIWMSINAVNCTDGVDGLSSSVGIVSMLSVLMIFSSSLPTSYFGYTLLFISVLLAYLLFNVSPSKILMGDAGSRALGVFLAILAIKSGHPISFLLFCAVFIIDGLTGLVKVFLLRFLKIGILKNIRTPLHDEMRKNHHWSDPQVVLRFSLAQIVFSTLLFIILSIH